jgi:CheY-like chemotaxis protein
MVQPTQPKPFTLMLVEKSPKSQEAFRRFFGSLGVRMLITTNAERALARLAEPSPPAKGIIFSGLELATEAAKAFNAMASHPDLKRTPAIMIATPKQQALIDSVQCDEKRRIVFVPLSVPDVVSMLAELFGYQPPPPPEKPA